MDHLLALDSLEKLHTRREAMANIGTAGAGWAAHAAVLDRLAANQRVAQSLGWTSCAIERAGAGRFCAWGVPPGDSVRHRIPDWSSEPG